MKTRDLLLIFLVVSTWGLHPPIIKLGIQDIPPLMLVSMRFFLTALVFLPFKKAMPAGLWWPFFLWVMVHYIGQMTVMFLALDHMEASTMALVFQAQVPFAIILGWLVHGEKFGLMTLAGLITAFVGLILIYGSPALTGWVGFALTLTSAFFWGLGSNLMRFIKGIDFGTMSFYSCLISLPFTLTASFLAEEPSFDLIRQAHMPSLIFVLAYQVIVMSAMMFLWKELINRNRVEKVSAFVLLQPLFGVLGGVALLGESVFLQTLAGGLLAMAGVALIVLRRIKTPTASII